ncbi:Dyp-type peroxidase family [Tenacibaculum sp. 190524A02b]|uniref:Dyp-type peroxidase n=1 Tax=Tenacibaculum vairaonense TaxID=3137860 RepID=UPI0032B13D8F
MNINSTWPVIKLSQSKMDIDNPAFSEVFNDIQGNILKSHGRTHSRHLFLQFKGSIDTNRKWVNTLAQNLTSALEQHHTSLDYKKAGNEHLFTGFMLSYSGYKALGIDDSKIPDDKAFRAGMKDTSFRYDTGPEGVHKRTVNPLNDKPDNWEFPFQQKIDALLILAYGGDNLDNKVSESYLDNEIQIIKNETHDVLSILTIEKGYVLRNEQGMVIEHFGFVDGLSNPVFLKSDYEEWEKEGTDTYDPSAPFGLVAVNDANGKNPDISFGSYFVYRKMQQNLKGFKNQSKEFASELSNSLNSRVEEEFAKALAFGRYKDGTPLVKNSKAILNNFDYQNDMEGLKCPFHSHIRKTNPRGDTNRKSNTPLRNERSKRIVRRGISYGSKDLDPKEEWTDAGLLFLSCQSDIEQQFLVMQCGWSDNANFLNEGVGHDPITGDQNANTNEKNKSWNLEINGKKITTNFRYKDLVKVKGGEYFFAPSISFCKNLINNNT